MIRKFNYTSREKINRSDMILAIDESNTDPKLRANLRFENYRAKLPAHGVIYVEAYHRAKYQRFNFGTIGHFRSPEDLSLRKFTRSDLENIHFRIKVVDETEKHGRIIAMAEGIGKVDNELLETSMISLLGVDFADLDQRIWEMDFERPDTPWLIINSRLTDPNALLKNNEIFFCTIYPEIVRQILTEVLSEESESYSPDDDCEDWQYYWLCFGRKLAGERWPSNTDHDKCRSWIDNAVNGFCRQHRVLQRIETSEGQSS